MAQLHFQKVQDLTDPAGLFTEAKDTIVFHLSQCINYYLFKLNFEFCLGNVCNHLLIGISHEGFFFIFCFVYVPRSAKHVSCSVLLKHTGTSSPSHVCCHPPMPGTGGAGCVAVLSVQSPGWKNA